MAKAKTEPKTDPGTLSVEMTPEQFDRFTKAEAETQNAAAAAAEAAKLSPPMRMVLNFQHHINGIKYGPGNVIIPGDIAGTIAYSEDAKRQELLKLNSDNGRMLRMFQAGQSVPTPVK